MIVRLPLPLPFNAPEGLYKYAEYESNNPRAFMGPYEKEMLDLKSKSARDWGYPNSIVTYGLGEKPLAWLQDHHVPFRLERNDKDASGSIMFIHLAEQEVDAFSFYIALL